MSKARFALMGVWYYADQCRVQVSIRDQETGEIHHIEQRTDQAPPRADVEQGELFGHGQKE